MTSNGHPYATSDEERTRPTHIGHWGIKTTPEAYDQLVQWHLDFWGGRVVYSTPAATFISYDEEHHRMVILNHADKDFSLTQRLKNPGIYHMAFTFDTLKHLADSYEEKKSRGILPHWPVNHGMSTSLYYYDPDGNEFEMQVDNFDTSEEAMIFMNTPEYKLNPIGVDLDMNQWLKRVRSDEPEEDIKKRPVIGERLTRWDNSLYFSPEKPLGTLYVPPVKI